MSVNSWWHVPAQDARFVLPQDLRDRDALRGVDCGWVEQMAPFIASHARPGTWVLDPFCGFASTLVAAWQAGMQAVGVDLSEARVRMARERLARLGVPLEQCALHAGSLSDPLLRERLRLRAAGGAAPGGFGLCLTNIPYFGCRQSPDPGGREGPAQLYQQPHYEAYLQGLREVFKGVHQLLAPEGWCIVTVQNLRLGSTFVPLAWDVARLLAERFVLHDERILLYERPHGGPGGPAEVGNRAHEYALIFHKQGPGMDEQAALALLSQLSAKGFEFVLYGSLARRLAGGVGAAEVRAHDMDLLVPPDDAALSRLLQCLEAEGFRIESWNAHIRPPVSIQALGYRHYVRARRLNHRGESLQVDVAIEPDWGGPRFMDALVRHERQGAPPLWLHAA